MALIILYLPYYVLWEVYGPAYNLPIIILLILVMVISGLLNKTKKISYKNNYFTQEASDLISEYHSLYGRKLIIGFITASAFLIMFSKTFIILFFDKLIPFNQKIWIGNIHITGAIFVFLMINNGMKFHNMNRMSSKEVSKKYNRYFLRCVLYTLLYVLVMYLITGMLLINNEHISVSAFEFGSIAYFIMFSVVFLGLR